ncbi:hypothetical protein KIL84_023039 [Mauremys mutica]|uniref:Uncharacterized protein n=1 Tax=Mauremys mutica TaxID=74926 RepID=A0A9D4ARD4_9SAUR|nr:hypothetical protein KIL84_023039 [Mauremys mutica]
MGRRNVFTDPQPSVHCINPVALPPCSRLCDTSVTLHRPRRAALRCPHGTELPLALPSIPSTAIPPNHWGTALHPMATLALLSTSIAPRYCLSAIVLSPYLHWLSSTPNCYPWCSITS